MTYQEELCAYLHTQHQLQQLLAQLHGEGAIALMDEEL